MQKVEKEREKDRERHTNRQEKREEIERGRWINRYIEEDNDGKERMKS